MRKVVISLFVLGSAIATPAFAQVTPAPSAPTAYSYDGDDLPPGCFRVLPGGLVFCLPMPI